MLADLKVDAAVISLKSDSLMGNKTLSPPCNCELWQTDHILCADSSTCSPAAEIASILFQLQHINNLQMKMTK